MKQKGNGKVGVINFPIEQAGVVPLSHLIGILHEIYGRTVLITGNDGYRRYENDASVTLHNVVHRQRDGPISRIVQYLITQMRISRMVLRDDDRVAVWVFFIGGEGLLLPILAARSKGKKVVLSMAGSVPEQLAGRNDPFTKAYDILLRINLSLVDRIVLYTPNLVQRWHFTRWKDKIVFAHEHYVDTDEFRVKTPFGQREDLVGYIGRLTVEKGIMDFVNAMPAVLREMPSLRFVIGGDGAAKDDVANAIGTLGVKDNVIMAGWVAHEALPDMLNRLKLLVLPSSTEGLPNIVIEALSCGTPVLVTPVGSLPGLIVDSETGYLIEGDPSDGVVKGILRALRDPNLKTVADRGNDMVRKEFTFENAKAVWARVLDPLLEGADKNDAPDDGHRERDVDRDGDGQAR